MIRAIKWIRDLLFQNLPWKLLSLATAVVIWALVATEPELTTMANVRLEYRRVLFRSDSGPAISESSLEVALPRDRRGDLGPGRH